MTTIVTNDGVRLVLSEDFSNRWQGPKNIQDSLKLPEVALPVSLADVNELIQFDRQARMKASKTYAVTKQVTEGYEIVSQTTEEHIGLFVASMSQIGHLANGWDPATDEWRVFVDIDEASDGKKEAYLRLGTYLRVYGNNELDFTLVGLPESTVLYEYRGEGEAPEEYELERCKRIANETPWISIMVAILYSIYQSAPEGLYAQHCAHPDPQATHWASYAAFVPSGAHVILQEHHTIEEWGLSLPAISQLGFSHATLTEYYEWLEHYDGLQVGAVNIDVLIWLWYNRTDVKDRIRVADATAGFYAHRRQYLISPTIHTFMTTKRTTHKAILPGTSYRLDEESDVLEFSINEVTLQALIIHTFRTRDRSLPPGSLGLGGTPFIECEESVGNTVYATPETLTAIYLSKALQGTESLIQLPDEALLEIAIAYSDWKKIIQEEQDCMPSLTRDKVEYDELEGLLADAQEPLGEDLYCIPDAPPQGREVLHTILYATNDLYRTLSDNEAWLLSYLAEK